MIMDANAKKEFLNVNLCGILMSILKYYRVDTRSPTTLLIAVLRM